MAPAGVAARTPLTTRTRTSPTETRTPVAAATVAFARTPAVAVAATAAPSVRRRVLNLCGHHPFCEGATAVAALRRLKLAPQEKGSVRPVYAF